MPSKIRFVRVADVDVAVHVSEPANVAQDAVRALFICPGFGSSASGGGTAELLRLSDELGFPAIAVEFEGHGKSSGSKDNLTISRAGDQLDAVFETFRPRLPTRGAACFGSSFGGTAALACQAKRGFFSALFLRSPAVDYCEARQFEYGTRGIDKWRESGTLEIPSGSGAIRSTYAFYEDAQQRDILAQAGKIKCPVVVCHGDGDRNVPHAQSVALVQRLGGTRSLHLFAGAGHGYDTDASRREYRRVLVDFLRRFVLGEELGHSA